MTTTQIYTLVNAVNSEAFGAAALSVQDTAGLISLGTSVLSSSTNTEAFLNTLVQRIGRTIISYRKYQNKLADMVMDDFEWGAIVQKIRVHMPDAEADQSYGLTDGTSVDHYVVAKPVVDQKLFVTRAPYQFHVTIQRKHLKEAFLSESAMGRFISSVIGQVRNAMDVSLENLGRITLANMVGETVSREIKLLTEYNTATGSTLTAASALFDTDFLAYAMRRINETIDAMQEMGVNYNDGSIETFTPREDLRVKLISPFVRAAETVLQYKAFNEEFVRPDSGYQKLAFWQAADSPMEINIKRVSDGTAENVENIVAILHDRDALGMFRNDEEVVTTPVNAAGLYYNTYYHARQIWFNSLDENFVFFTLN